MAHDQMRELGLTPKQMSKYEMASTMKAATVGIRSWWQIVKCFVTVCEIERETLTMSEHVWRKLGTDHGKIDSEKYTYSPGKGKRPEIIQWWTMDAASELELRLTDFANHVPNFHPSMIEIVSYIYTAGDHGKRKFRFGTKLVV